jgi:alkyl hydroperoxide reductase subunit AhpC
MENNSLIGQYSPDFEIPTTTGEVYHFGSELKRHKLIVVSFIHQDSHSMIVYLKNLYDQFKDQGLGIVVINADTGVSLDTMKELKQSENFDFPYIRDTTGDVVKSFNVDQMPTVFAIDHQFVVRYGGQVEANETELQTMIADLLNA